MRLDVPEPARDRPRVVVLPDLVVVMRRMRQGDPGPVQRPETAHHERMVPMVDLTGTDRLRVAQERDGELNGREVVRRLEAGVEHPFGGREDQVLQRIRLLVQPAGSSPGQSHVVGPAPDADECAAGCAVRAVQVIRRPGQSAGAQQMLTDATRSDRGRQAGRQRIGCPGRHGA